MAKDNLALWNSVQMTDPEFTKDFNKGTYKGTATNVVWLCKQVTKQFGPIGEGWGWEIMEDREVRNGDSTAAMWYTKLRVWHKNAEGEVCWSGPQWGGTDLYGAYKSGKSFFDEDAPKKSVTDALSKSLSYLGFGADIHMGLFDDNKYVASADRQWADKEKEEKRGKTENEDDTGGPSKATVTKGSVDKRADRSGHGDTAEDTTRKPSEAATGKGATDKKADRREAKDYPNIDDINDWEIRATAIIKEIEKIDELVDWWNKLSDFRGRAIANHEDHADIVIGRVKEKAQKRKQLLIDADEEHRRAVASRKKGED